MKILQTSVALLLAIICCGSVYAQEQSPVVFSNIAQKEVVTFNANGNESVALESVEIVLPGDTIVYTSTFTNQGNEAVSDIVVNNPVPANTEYLGFSARGENTEVVFSVDGGELFASTVELTLVDADGEVRNAQPADYTNIRWIYSGELAPGASSSVSFKVRIP